MKKTYMAPVIAVEHYELTQAIAACNLKIGYLDSECVLKDSTATNDMKDFAYDGGFTSGNCMEPVGNGEEGDDGICYHTNANAAFNS